MECAILINKDREGKALKAALNSLVYNFIEYNYDYHGLTIVDVESIKKIKSNIPIILYFEQNNFDLKVIEKYVPYRVIINSMPLRCIETVLTTAVRRLINDQNEAKENRKKINLLQEVIHLVDQAPDMYTALKQVLAKICKNTGWIMGEAWILDKTGTVLVNSKTTYTSDPSLEAYFE